MQAHQACGPSRFLHFVLAVDHEPPADKALGVLAELTKDMG